MITVRRVLTAIVISLLLVASGAMNSGATTGPDITKIKDVHPPIHFRNGAYPTYTSGYTPPQIKNAYVFNQLAYSGLGQKIAIVDAFGSSTIKNDLSVFDKQFNLPAANLSIYYPKRSHFKNDPNWGLEASLDVEWAHAIAP